MRKHQSLKRKAHLQSLTCSHRLSSDDVYVSKSIIKAWKMAIGAEKEVRMARPNATLQRSQSIKFWRKNANGHKQHISSSSNKCQTAIKGIPSMRKAPSNPHQAITTAAVTLHLRKWLRHWIGVWISMGLTMAMQTMLRIEMVNQG